VDLEKTKTFSKFNIHIIHIAVSCLSILDLTVIIDSLMLKILCQIMSDTRENLFCSSSRHS